jgi:hypothetical protein
LIISKIYPTKKFKYIIFSLFLKKKLLFYFLLWYIIYCLPLGPKQEKHLDSQKMHFLVIKSGYFSIGHVSIQEAVHSVRVLRK